MDITRIPCEGYEEVVRAEDRTRGFRALVAVHSTVLGPGLGGMRMWSYPGFDEALTDVLRLAQGMTYKSAVARTGLGGGKSVILGDARKDKSEELFLWMGRVVDSLGGRYITAEDVGTSVEDVDVVARETRHVSGRARAAGGSGDPSPFTALGTFRAIEASLGRAFGDPATAGRTVAVQGLGHVGFSLARFLHEAGASLVVSDLYPERAAQAEQEFGARVVGPEEILRVPCDVLAPCALGAVLDDASIPALACRVVCGAANNQLAEPRHGAALRARGVLYAPDFVVNAGGVINIAVELGPGGYDEARATARIGTIPEALEEIFDLAEKRRIPTAEAALEVAQGILAEAARRRSAPAG